MKTTRRAWTPTMTLAGLFEEQHQFFDALATYELISQTESSPEIRKRIEALHLRILNEPSLRYDPRIEKLFTPEELAYFKVLDHSGFENMSLAYQKLAEGSLAEDILIEEEEDFTLEMDGDESLLDQLLGEIESQAQVILPELVNPLENKSLRHLLVSLLGRYDMDTPLKDIKLSDLISALLELQVPNKNEREN